MKKIILLLSIFSLFGSSVVFSQTQENATFAICGTVENTIKQSDIANCNVLVPVNKNLIIKSFILTTSFSGVYEDFKCTGNKLSEGAINAIKNASSGTKFLIEQIIASDGKTEAKYSGFQFQIK